MARLASRVSPRANLILPGRFSAFSIVCETSCERRSLEAWNFSAVALASAQDPTIRVAVLPIRFRRADVDPRCRTMDAAMVTGNRVGITGECLALRMLPA
jgi:hypothetical protein